MLLLETIVRTVSVMTAFQRSRVMPVPGSSVHLFSAVRS
jgi:hypothetical protein